MLEQVGQSEENVRAVIEPFVREPGGLLPALTALTDRFGYVEEEYVPAIADAFNLSRAEVHGVITFYHDFRTKKPGKHIVKICQAEACQAHGSRDLTEHAEKSLKIKLHETNDEVTLEPVYCLGNCALTPSVMIDDEVFGRITPERFDKILATFKAKEAAK